MSSNRLLIKPVLAGVSQPKTAICCSISRLKAMMTCGGGPARVAHASATGPCSLVLT